MIKIGQKDVVDLIHKIKKGVSSREIARILKIKTGAVSKNFMKIREWHKFYRVKWTEKKRPTGGRYLVYYPK